MNEKASGESLPLEVDIHEAQALLSADMDICLVDVREPEEIQFCRLAGSVNIPMMQLPESMQSLPRDKRILVLCHHGQRSLYAARFMRSNGWESVQSIRGGIEAWSRGIDPSIPRY